MIQYIRYSWVVPYTDNRFNEFGCQRGCYVGDSKQHDVL